MAETVDVTLLVPAREGGAGDRVSVDSARAKILVDGGAAQYSTKTAAKKAGGDPSTAATAK